MPRLAPLVHQLAHKQPLASRVPSRAFSTTLARHQQPPAQPSRLLPELTLKDKVVIVAGAARGLGLTQAEALCEAGATVHVVDRLPTPADDADSDFSVVAKRARDELGTSLSYHRIDVRDGVHLNKTFATIADEKGRLDGLMAAAGIQFETPALEYPQDEVERMLSTNVAGCFMTAQAAARQMVRLECPGSIAMVASMSGSAANRGLYSALYNSSKAAVIQMARSLAAEWGQRGIRVNTLSPGYIQTKMLLSLFERFPERKIQWSSENMLNRVSTPNEFRGAAVFLLSDASSFMTGSDLKIDGGHTAW